MNQISQDHEKLRAVLISKLGLPTDRFQRDNQIAESVDKLRTERDELVTFGKKLADHLELPTIRFSGDVYQAIDTLRTERDDTHKALCKLLQGDYHSESSIQLVKRVEGLVKALRNERDDALGTINGLKQLVELPESAGLTELFNTVEALELNKSERYLLLAAQPQLNEIKYVLHGDIQPCTVLYTDDTTTLLRLDENDMMLETETIEWSDVTAYRCQELLRASQGKQHVSVATVKAVAQLVRDERILLVDESPVDSDEELLRSAIEPALAPLVVPAAPAVVVPGSCGNPYVHDNVVYPEAGMRAAGWQTEDLVQNGYGHYKHVPCAERADAFDKFNQKLGQHLTQPSNAEKLWRCTECFSDFSISLDLCPKCHTPKER